MSDNFVAGRIAEYVHEWRKLTSDATILDIVEHFHIDLELNGSQCEAMSSTQYVFNKKETEIIDREIDKLLELKVIKNVESCHDQVLSPIFLRPKSNGELRMVLNF